MAIKNAVGRIDAIASALAQNGTTQDAVLESGVAFTSELTAAEIGLIKDAITRELTKLHPGEERFNFVDELAKAGGAVHYICRLKTLGGRDADWQDTAEEFESWFNGVLDQVFREHFDRYYLPDADLPARWHNTPSAWSFTAAQALAPRPKKT
jgi:hypothetical protein